MESRSYSIVWRTKVRDIAMVFQSYALYPHMNVRENLEFGLRMRGVSAVEMNRRVSAAAGMTRSRR